MTIALRATLLIVGILLAWHGATTLLDFPTPALLSVILWFSAGILLHDFLFAPLAAAVGLGGRRLLPTRWWAPTACGAVCTVTLLLLAAPVLGRGDAMSDNPTILDRPYALGLAAALLTVWSVVAIISVIGRAGE
ncbi:hypothetical protein [Nocardia bovistercoris]|uniref:Uncharacterized protein n=1 Tax=Nocardia bovistercoris TaxID=2785916 RepID=A0A931N4M4_9NOCA|nr:hypothetical protein [Nocardia bovistercoris]